jgi:1-acyl-sn-glycerol-3-phosphate acyltransferase
MIKQTIALYFKLSGWNFINNVPDDVRSFVFLGAPHTSNYDIIPTLAVARLMGRNAKFIIKSDWLKFPLNIVLVPLGAIGIDRNKLKQNNRLSHTDTMAQFFKEYSELALMISPEATRGPNPNWKTGFYYIAQKAGVPIVLGFADYARKEAGLGKVIYPSDFAADMKAIMEFYSSIGGRKPENFKLDEKY